MDESYRPRTLTCNNQWIFIVVLAGPTNAALNLVGVLHQFWEVIESPNRHGLFQFLLVELFGGHALLITPEILDSKTHPSDFDGVKFLNFVIILAIFVL
jgi:hypothetical protein